MLTKGISSDIIYKHFGRDTKETQTKGADPWKRHSEKNKEEKKNSQIPKWVKRQAAKRVPVGAGAREAEWMMDWTEEFDPGSGRTLAACLTHASRAGMDEVLAQNLF